ncbi:MAG TPA: transglutaminase-like domain-containing protein [Candidatus Nanoarchaeia archaeon]|nr:transglutaminase-like domain-containing protein [Candidatus Nanoarchaeia archaeon]
MRLVLCLFAIIALLPSVIGVAELYNAESLIIELNISSAIDIVKTGESPILKELNVNLSFFPRNWDTQRVLSMKTMPDANLEDDILLFRWEENIPNNTSFLASSEVKTFYNPLQVKKKIQFPVEEFPPELKIYTMPSETIDSNDEEIIRLASRLAEGEDDLYVVVHKLAAWTRDNVEYDLSTLTADVTQKSSWVMKNRKGVCDEITNLFIALVRALGMPAKFVSGISYTESDLFPENWGPHGWAEVYFPGFGWVPFDVTFGELGYIDPTHIKLKEAVDSQKPATHYYWRGRDTDINVNPLEFDAAIKSKGRNLGYPLQLNLVPLRQDVGFGSFNLIEVKIKNLQDYYIAREVFISGPNEIIFFDTKKDVLLRPNEMKSVYFAMKLNGELSPRYIYTMPLEVRTVDNNTAKSFLSVADKNIVYDEEFIKDVLEQRQDSEKKAYSKEVNIKCEAGNEIRCNLKNTGNIILSDLSVCVETNCQSMDLAISQEKSVAFPIEEKKPGNYEHLVSAKNKDVSVSTLVPFSILDNPNLEISNVISPNSSAVIGEFALSFVLKKTSFSNPVNVSVSVSNGVFRRTWSLDELKKDEQLSAIVSGKSLGIGDNEFSIEATYFDFEGNLYFARENFGIENTTPFFSADNLRHLMFETPYGATAMVAVSAALAFLIVILFVFRRRK